MKSTFLINFLYKIVRLIQVKKKCLIVLIRALLTIYNQNIVFFLRLHFFKKIHLGNHDSYQQFQPLLLHVQ